MFDMLELYPPEQGAIMGAGVHAGRGQDCGYKRGLPVYGSGADIAIACEPCNKPFESIGPCLGVRNRYQVVDPARFDQMLEGPGPSGLRRPRRGTRGDHATSAIIVALKNREAILKRQLGDIPPGANWCAVRNPSQPVPASAESHLLLSILFVRLHDACIIAILIASRTEPRS